MTDTRIIPCTACGGDKGHHDFAGRWETCAACNGTGDEEIELKPIEMLVDADWLRLKTETDPDVDCEAR